MSLTRRIVPYFYLNKCCDHDRSRDRDHDRICDPDRDRDSDRDRIRVRDPDHDWDHHLCDHDCDPSKIIDIFI